MGLQKEVGGIVTPVVWIVDTQLARLGTHNNVVLFLGLQAKASAQQASHVVFLSRIGTLGRPPAADIEQRHVATDCRNQSTPILIWFTLLWSQGKTLPWQPY